MRDLQLLSLRYMTGGIVIVFGSFLLADVVSVTQLLPDSVVISSLLPALMGGFLVGFKGISYAHRHRDKIDDALAIGDLNGIGYLVDCVETKLKYANSALYKPEERARFNAMWQNAIYKLISLLPQLSIQFPPLLSERQWRVLYSALKSRDGHLVLAVLETAERLGDRRALHYVEELAAGKWKAETDTQVRQAAEDCLRVLREQEEAARSGKVLLRAAQAEQAAPDIMLRAATGATQATKTELLRAGISHDQR